MSTVAFAVFVSAGFLLPVPLLHWLDRPRAAPDPRGGRRSRSVSPGFTLEHIDWSHSLVMALVWSGAFALLFHRWGRKVMSVMALAAFSHFVLDLPMHPPDLTLWPGSSIHLGMGLWQSLPNGWWLVELGVIAFAAWYYVSRAMQSTEFGGRPLAVVVLVLLLHLSNSPWLSPL